MIKKAMEEALNKQITKEMYSSNLYLAMSAYYAKINLNGFSHWMRVQAQEEMTHALKLFDYILDRGGDVKIDAIDATPSDWDNALVGFEEVFKHEQSISASINELADLAIKEGDHATHSMLIWFINEQVEEEANVSDIVERIRLAQDSPGGLFMIDNELKSRVFVDETKKA